MVPLRLKLGAPLAMGMPLHRPTSRYVCALRRTAGILLLRELVCEQANAEEVHDLRHDEQVVMVLDHQPHQEESLCTAHTSRTANQRCLRERVAWTGIF